MNKIDIFVKSNLCEYYYVIKSYVRECNFLHLLSLFFLDEVCQFQEFYNFI